LFGEDDRFTRKLLVPHLFHTSILVRIDIHSLIDFDLANVGFSGREIPRVVVAVGERSDRLLSALSSTSCPSQQAIWHVLVLDALILLYKSLWILGFLLISCYIGIFSFDNLMSVFDT